MIRVGYIAVVGRPNVGKSTLFNEIIGSEISIATEKAQTTRSQLLGVLTKPNEYQIALLDTPGVHRARNEGLNTYMNDEAEAALNDADVVWYLVSKEGKLKDEEPILERLQKAKKPIIRIRTKVDLGFPEDFKLKLAEIDSRLGELVKKTLSISTVEKRGLKTLMNQSLEFIPSQENMLFPEDQITDKPTRYFVGEIVRKHILLQFREEIPYGCAVKVVNYKEDNALDRIECEIVVERESQKPILVGAKGVAIKNLGQTAREEIEEFIGKKAFLGLKVTVVKDWTKNKKALEELGYHVV